MIVYHNRKLIIIVLRQKSVSLEIERYIPKRTNKDRRCF